MCVARDYVIDTSRSKVAHSAALKNGLIKAFLLLLPSTFKFHFLDSLTKLSDATSSEEPKVRAAVSQQNPCDPDKKVM